MREQIQRYAHETLSIELAEAQRLCSRLNDSFVSACEAILAYLLHTFMVEHTTCLQIL